MTIVFRPRRMVEKADTVPPEEARFAAAVAAALRAIRDALPQGLAAAIDRGQGDQGLQLDLQTVLEGTLLAAVLVAVRGVAQETWSALMERVRPTPPTFTISSSFESIDPELVNAARTITAQLVREITPETRAGIRAVLAAAAEQRLSGRDAVELIRSMVGLTSRQVGAVERFRLAQLAAGRTPAQAQQLAAGYAARARRARAALIATTEFTRAAGAGRQATWNAAVKAGLLDAAKTEKTWTAHYGACPTICEPINGQRVPIAGHFTLPNGEQVMTPPGHPACRCVMTLSYVGEPVAKYNASQARDAHGQWAGRGGGGRNSSTGGKKRRSSRARMDDLVNELAQRHGLHPGQIAYDAHRGFYDLATGQALGHAGVEATKPHGSQLGIRSG